MADSLRAIGAVVALTDGTAFFQSCVFGGGGGVTQAGTSAENDSAPTRASYGPMMFRIDGGNASVALQNSSIELMPDRTPLAIYKQGSAYSDHTQGISLVRFWRYRRRNRVWK